MLSVWRTDVAKSLEYVCELHFDTDRCYGRYPKRNHDSALPELRQLLPSTQTVAQSITGIA